MASIDIIIVDYNTGPYLRSCLESIEQNNSNKFALHQVIIIDNASKPASRDYLSGIDLPLRLIINRKNMGFAYACNQGAKLSCSEYLLFLNPDTRIIGGALEKAISFMEDSCNNYIGICGIQLVDEGGSICRTCSRFPTISMYLNKAIGLSAIGPSVFRNQLMEEWDHTHSRRVDQVIGAFFLTRRRIFEQVGGFDTRFFLYFEEVDYAYRLKKIGWQSYYLATARIFHKGAASSEKIKPERLYYSLKSRILYGMKHYTKLMAFLLFVETAIFEFFPRLFITISPESEYGAMHILTAYGLLWRDIFSGRYIGKDSRAI